MEQWAKREIQNKLKGGLMMTDTFIICNNEDEIKSNKSCWGNQTFEISAQDIAALLEGKTLTAMVNDEYGIFIKIEADSRTVEDNDAK